MTTGNPGNKGRNYTEWYGQEKASNGQNCSIVSLDTFNTNVQKAVTHGLLR